MEIERYTLATGESAITGFARFWKPWWWLFIVFALLQNFWPGWATGASTTASFAPGERAGASGGAAGEVQRLSLRRNDLWASSVAELFAQLAAPPGGDREPSSGASPSSPPS
jgi:hypothetical protein